MKCYERSYDVAVIGGGPAGLATAVTAARAGKQVLLADKNGFLGGNLTIGLPLLGFLDEHGNRCIGGFAQELVDRLQARGACYGVRPCPKHNSVANMDAEAVKLLAFELCREAGVEVLLHVEAVDARVEAGAIKTVTPCTASATGSRCPPICLWTAPATAIWPVWPAAATSWAGGMTMKPCRPLSCAPSKGWMTGSCWIMWSSIRKR